VRGCDFGRIALCQTFRSGIPAVAGARGRMVFFHRRKSPDLAGLQYFAAFAAFAVLAVVAMLVPGRKANMAVLLLFLSLYPIFALIGPVLRL
jgi:hypothetical protein